MPKNEKNYELTEWGCLYGVLTEYGIDASHITGTIGKHLVDDFMDAMCKFGYVEKKENEDGN